MIIKPFESEEIEKDGKQVHPRTDVKTRGIVDKAIELQSMLGTQIAAGLLQAQNVPFHVAKRVLLNPSKRRKFK